MEMLGKIRRVHVRDKMSVRAIAKRTGLSRNTLQKWLQTPKDVKKLKYVRAKVFSKLGVFTDELEQALKSPHAGLPHEAVRQSRLLAGGLPQPGSRDAVRCPHALIYSAGRRCQAGHLRQHVDLGFCQDRRGQDQKGQGPHCQCPLCRA